MTLKNIPVVFFALTLVATVSCRGPEATAIPPAPPDIHAPADAEEAPVLTAVPTLPATPLPTPTSTPATQVRPHIDGALEFLSSDLEVPRDSLTAIASEPVDWSDTSLGCPEPGYMYAQVITPGYKVSIEFEGVSYLVHADSDGSNAARCDETNSNNTCTLTGGEVVQDGWSGKDTGSNFCNQCFCTGGALGCTKMACPAMK